MRQWLRIWAWVWYNEIMSKTAKKTRGKTNLTRLLRAGKPLKFFSVPEERMREFTQEAKRHGLLFVPSIGGLSHCPQEATHPEDLARGALVLEDALRELVSADV